MLWLIAIPIKLPRVVQQTLHLPRLFLERSVNLVRVSREVNAILKFMNSGGSGSTGWTITATAKLLVIEFHWPHPQQSTFSACLSRSWGVSGKSWSLRAPYHPRNIWEIFRRSWRLKFPNKSSRTVSCAVCSHIHQPSAKFFRGIMLSEWKLKSQNFPWRGENAQSTCWICPKWLSAGETLPGLSRLVWRANKFSIQQLSRYLGKHATNKGQIMNF